MVLLKKFRELLEFHEQSHAASMKHQEFKDIKGLSGQTTPNPWPVQDDEKNLVEKLIQIDLDGKSVMWVGNWLKDCK